MELPPGHWEQMWLNLRRRNVLARLAAGLLAAIAICAAVQGWDPPFWYESGYIPSADIVARVSFSQPQQVETRVAEELAQSRVKFVYVHNSEPLVKLRALLRHTVAQVTAAENLAGVNAEVWKKFSLDEDWPRYEQERAFQLLREELGGPEKLAQFEKDVALALAPFEQRGLLDKVSRKLGRGNYEEILVYHDGKPEPRSPVRIADVLLGDKKAIYRSLLEHLPSPDVAELVFAWLKPQITPTLTLDEVATKKALEEAKASVGPVLVKCEAGETLVSAGQRIDKKQLQVLGLEHAAAISQRTWGQRLARGSAMVGMIFALFLVGGIYLRHRQSQLLANRRQFLVMLASAVLTAIVAHMASADLWQAELIPLLLFGMTASIACCQEVAVVTTGLLAAAIALSTGQGLGQSLVLTGVSITAILQVGQIRGRAKLIHVGLLAGGMAMILDATVTVLSDQPLDLFLLAGAFRTGLWALAAGFLMTGLLPFVENFFGVLTDLSLLELSAGAHPLLQELVRRAPATYNHSITVGSIAEAAADSIGGRGLLVRVGAYFHDIGKMLKPGYFIENQGNDPSRHETLLPAMSTLVIIAHVKDGADLGRQRHLPKPIIDLIEQHHGTTLVEYFFGRAQEQMEQDANGQEVDENSFRYPGPKPQTKEAGVLMLADAVEGASRALVEPNPARIESLVREMAERRLQDGQFDESGLTLRELRTIQRSLVKSLTALYHGRIKYPEQRTA